MPRPRKPTTLNDQLALLNDPSPTDFDPEALEAEYSPDERGESGSDSGSDAEDDEVDHAREHYVAVGKSRLRKAPELEALGEAYVGAKVSRGKLYDDDDEEEEEDEDESESGSGSEDEDEDEDMDDEEGSGVSVYSEDSEIPSEDAFGSDDEQFKDWKFRGSRTTEGGRPAVNGDKITGSSSDEEESDDSGSASESEDSNDDQSGASDEEASDDDDDEDAESSSDESTHSRLRALLSKSEQTTTQALTTTLTREQQKGTAIRTQRSLFDSLLRSRIHLQKPLSTTTTLPLPLPKPPLSDTDAEEARNKAEEAALELFNSISALRAPIYNAVSAAAAGKKRNHEAAFTPTAFTSSTPTSEIWDSLESLGSLASPLRAAVLDKWAAKTQPVTVDKPRLNASSSTSSSSSNRNTTGFTRNILSHLATATLPGAIEKSRILSTTSSSSSTTAPAASSTPEADPAEIYDDTDFYSLLLRSLIDSRLVATGSASSSSSAGDIQWALSLSRATKKKRKVVDTRASKGRKLKYLVHDRLVGFMAPVDGHDRWRDEQRRELFAGLLGVRNGLLDEDDNDDDDDDDDEDGGSDAERQGGRGDRGDEDEDVMMAEEEGVRLFAS